ncbi:MAG: proline racemase family protein [Desulfobacteraceae bacterium]|nr:MAG: proline racemase family protein [Desulfobacteraceae bacterium]
MHLDTKLFSTFENQILTIDLHVAGEPLRLIIDGVPAINGSTVNDKRLYFGENFDHIRVLLTKEPRGHRDMFAGIVTDPVNKESHFGIVFMDALRYPYMCGHGIIGAVTAFIEMGWLDAYEGENLVAVDTPSGPIRSTAYVREATGGRPRVESVATQLESAFAFLLDKSLEVPGYGQFTVDVAYAGGFFVMVPIDQTGFTLSSENAPELARLGMAVIDAGNQQLKVRHPLLAYINTIDVVEFFEPVNQSLMRGKNIVILGEGHVDRSPCGTGTSAKLALLHGRGELQPGQTLVNEGMLGTTFEGRIIREINVGGISAIVPEIRGSAYVTGLHRFVLTPGDPFTEGFLV